MSPFALRLRTLNATALGNESASGKRPTGAPPPDLRSLSQRLDPDQQGRDMVPTGES
jgi:hypothetical protein